MAASYTLSSLIRSTSRSSSSSCFRFILPPASCSENSFRFYSTGPGGGSSAAFSPQEVTEILRKHEFSSGDFPESVGPIKSFDTSTLNSNNPSEDSKSVARFQKLSSASKNYLFGIFDGHGGVSCGQVVARRLLNYVSAGLITQEQLRLHFQAIEDNDTESPHYNLLETFNDDPFVLHQDLQVLYQKSYHDYIKGILSDRVQRADNDEDIGIEETFINAFEALDNDMTLEAETMDTKTLTVAMTGSVGVVAHVDGQHLHIASTGDCTAVLGSLNENDTWTARKLTTEHNSDNANEIKRILSKHPTSEHREIIKKDRLLGILEPLRAFGDFKFKWPKDKIVKLLGPYLGEYAVPPMYKTPPYLIVKPEVNTLKLTARDKFLVIATDGLWDMMTPMQVIRSVGEHMSGKITLSPLELSRATFSLSEVNSVLRHRQAAMKLKPTDSNAATHLIRCALGGTAYGVDHGRLSQMLSIPQDMVRMFRDDITVTVVFFDSEFLRHV